MKTKIKKILNIMCITVVLLTTVFPNLLTTVVQAATATVVYNATAEYGGSKVGNFSVNGKQAFCMEHAKHTPQPGTSLTSSVYNDENIAKCLYYRMDWTRSMEPDLLQKIWES